MKASRFLFTISLIVFSLYHINSIHGQSRYYVNASAQPGGDGLSWNTSFQTLQQAIETACNNAPAHIWVAAGTYYPMQNPDTTSSSHADRTNTFTLCNGVAIYGGFAGVEIQLEERDWIINLTILSGDINHDDT